MTRFFFSYFLLCSLLFHLYRVWILVSKVFRTTKPGRFQSVSGAVVVRCLVRCTSMRRIHRSQHAGELFSPRRGCLNIFILFISCFLVSIFVLLLACLMENMLGFDSICQPTKPTTAERETNAVLCVLPLPSRRLVFHRRRRRRRQNGKDRTVRALKL